MSLSPESLRFRSPTLLAKLVTAGFVPYLAGSLYLMWFLLQGVTLMKAHIAGEDVTAEAFGPIDAAIESTSIGLIAFRILGILVFCFWTYRVARNRDVFQEPGDSPGWCVGWYFVPIASLWRPMQALRTVWEGSDPTPRAEGDFRLHQGTPIYFKAWWAMWITSLILLRVSDKWAEQISGPESYVSWATFSVVAGIVDMIALALMLQVVWSLTRRQERRGAPDLARASVVADAS